MLTILCSELCFRNVLGDVILSILSVKPVEWPVGVLTAVRALIILALITLKGVLLLSLNIEIK